MLSMRSIRGPISSQSALDRRTAIVGCAESARDSDWHSARNAGSRAMGAQDNRGRDAAARGERLACRSAPPQSHSQTSLPHKGCSAFGHLPGRVAPNWRFMKRSSYSRHMVGSDVAAIIVERMERGAIPGIASVYLFGSEAEGRSHRESDVDVGILLDRCRHPSARDRFETRLALISELERGLKGRTVDVVILNDAPPQLGRHIATRGRRIYCSDTELDHAFVRDAQLRAADIDPFLQRMRAIKLRAIRKT